MCIRAVSVHLRWVGLHADQRFPSQFTLDCKGGPRQRGPQATGSCFWELQGQAHSQEREAANSPCSEGGAGKETNQRYCLLHGWSSRCGAPRGKGQRGKLPLSETNQATKEPGSFPGQEKTLIGQTGMAPLKSPTHMAHFTPFWKGSACPAPHHVLTAAAGKPVARQLWALRRWAALSQGCIHSAADPSRPDKALLWARL